MDPLADPSRFAGLLRKSQERIAHLEHEAHEGHLVATPEVIALVLRYTAGIVQALARGVAISS